MLQTTVLACWVATDDTGEGHEPSTLGQVSRSDGLNFRLNNRSLRASDRLQTLNKQEATTESTINGNRKNHAK